MFAAAIGPAITGVSSIAGALTTNKKDAERIASAERLFTRALAGDTAAMKEIDLQRQHSATAVGKAAHQRVWEALQASRTSVSLADLSPNPLQTSISGTLTRIQDQAALGVQEAGSIAVSGATRAIAPAGSSRQKAISVPTTERALYWTAAAVLALLLIVYISGRR